jgi:hypothetical protein
MVEALVVFYEAAGNGEELLVQHISNAAREFLDGVTLFSMSLGDGSAAGTVNRRPQEVLVLLKEVRDVMRGRARVDRAQAGFGGRYLST